MQQSRRERTITITSPLGSVPTGVRTPSTTTVGVEEEFLLVDPTTGRPVPVAPSVLRSRAALPPDPQLQVVLEPELQQQQVETATPPRCSLEELEADLRRLRREADRR